jgi:hypothetical protein
VNRQEKSEWIALLTMVLTIFGFAFWVYILFRLILKKIHRWESKRAKILLMALAPVLSIFILAIWKGLFYSFGFWGRSDLENYFLAFIVADICLTAVTCFWFGLILHKKRKYALLLSMIPIVIFFSAAFTSSSIWLFCIILSTAIIFLLLLLGLVLRTIHRRESESPKILLMAIVSAPVIFILAMWCWILSLNTDIINLQKHFFFYDYNAALVYGGLYLAVTALVYRLLKKKIKRRATAAILITCHVAIFATLIIGGGL